MRKLTSYVSLHDVSFDFVDGDDDVPFDLIDGKGLCCPNDPLDEVVGWLPAVDEPFLKALELDCSPPLAAGGGDAESKSGEQMRMDVGALDSRRALGADINEAASPSSPTVDVPWLHTSAVARKPRSRPATVHKKVWSLTSPRLFAVDSNNHHDEVSSGGGGGGGGEHSRPAKRRRKCEEEKKCGHCHTTETPQWRAGPDGPGTLCNACGIRYRMKNQLLPEYRPSTSPSFGSDEFSNRHSEVVKLREKKQKQQKVIMAMPAEALDAGKALDLCEAVHASS